MHPKIEKELNRSAFSCELKSIDEKSWVPIARFSILLNLELESDASVLEGKETFYHDFGKWFFENVRKTLAEFEEE